MALITRRRRGPRARVELLAARARRGRRARPRRGSPRAPAPARGAPRRPRAGRRGRARARPPTGGRAELFDCASLRGLGGRMRTAPLVALRSRVSTASAGSSVTLSRSRSSGETMTLASTRPRPSRAARASTRPKSTTGKCSTLPVWISVSASNISSSVPKPPGKMTNPPRLHEADLARVEVLERVLDVEVRVRHLLVRQLDVEADREAAAFLRAAVRRLHDAPPAAGDDRPAGLGEEPPVSGRRAYAGCSSPMRAEPKIATAGRSICGPARSRRRNSSAIRSTCSAESSSCRSRIWRSSIASEAARHVGPCIAIARSAASAK